MSSDALGGERLKLRIKRWRDEQVLVVLGNHIECLSFLLGTVKGAGRQFCRINGLSWNLPIDFFDRGVIHDPGFGPVVEAHRHEFAFFIGISRRQRLESMKYAPVPRRPWSQRKEWNKSCQYSSAEQRSPIPQGLRDNHSPQQVHNNHEWKHGAVRSQQRGASAGYAAPGPCHEA